jgi:2'-5' RNA ligase
VARLFVAIELSETVRQAIAAEQKRIVAAAMSVANVADAVRVAPGGAARCVQPDHLHVTLAFIGEVAEPRAAAISEAWAEPLPAAPFDLEFGAAGVFPPRGAPRVLWLGITSGAEQAGVVQRLVAARLEAIGIVLEKKPFHPHMTLARWPRGRRAGRMAGRTPGTPETPEGAERLPRAADSRRAIAAHRGTAIPRLAVDEVTLFQSRLSPSGSAYTPLARARLTAASIPPLQ